MSEVEYSEAMSQLWEAEEEVEKLRAENERLREFRDLDDLVAYAEIVGWQSSDPNVAELENRLPRLKALRDEVDHLRATCKELDRERRQMMQEIEKLSRVVAER